jgi:type III pantothenate kinase
MKKSPGILVVDIGNTRAKWAVLRGGRLGRGGVVVHEGDVSALDALVRAAPADISRVVAVSVASDKLNRALTTAARTRWKVTPEFVKSARRAQGVVNGYRDIWRLGADRWVAVIGAHALSKARPVLVANVGTALTVDLVTASGRHRGGAIIPAPTTMVASLLAGTIGIRRRARGVHASGRSVFAADTASALAAGSTFAAAAFIDRAVAEATQLLGSKPLLFLSGGGADALRRRLKTRARLLPDLVLRGLAVCASD